MLFNKVNFFIWPYRNDRMKEGGREGKKGGKKEGWEVGREAGREEGRKLDIIPQRTKHKN